MIKIECEACGGSLRQVGNIYACENCGTKYAIGRDDEGNPFTYRPIEKKVLSVGRFEAKATTIKVNTLQVKEIRLSESIAEDVNREGYHIEKNESIKMIPVFLEHGEWEAAQSQINQILLADSHCAEAQWFGMMCSRKVSTDKSLVAKLANITESDIIKLNDILSNSSPSFAREIISLMFEEAYWNDIMCQRIFNTILPYAHNQSVFTSSEEKSKGREALERTIEKRFAKSFELLLSTELSPDEVDQYMLYLERFGDKCNSADSQKYYEKILEVDPSNLNIHKKLVLADVVSNSAPEKTFADFESLLRHSDHPDKDTEWLLSGLSEENTTTLQKSQIFWQAMGYHSNAPEGVAVHIHCFAKTLLRSSLWEEANRCYQLLLSVDSRDAEAYWGLCHVRMQAQDDEALARKKENLIDCQEFKKALALYKSSGNDNRAAEIMSYTVRQKNNKYYKKLIIVAAGALLVVIGIIILFNFLKYNPTISLRFVNELYGRDWEDEQVDFMIKAQSWIDATRVSGTMVFYNAQNQEISRMTLNIPNLSHEKEKDYNLSINSTTAGELDGTRFSDLTITFAVTEIIFEDGKRKELGNGSEKVVKKYGEGKADYTSYTWSKYSKAMERYDKVNVTNSSSLYELTEAIALIDNDWNDIIRSWSILDDIYERADQYLKEEEYAKSYYLFSLLSVYLDYKDSTQKAKLCEYYLK